VVRVLSAVTRSLFIMSEARFATVPFSIPFEVEESRNDRSPLGLNTKSFIDQAKAFLDVASIYGYLVRHQLTVPLCSLIIGFVSAYDAYLTVMYVDSLQGMELNPVGRYMMGLDDPIIGENPQIAMFLGCKFAGTVIVLFVLQILWIWRRPLSSMVAMKVAFAQTLLACMLLFGPHRL
jgi:hypothetical protein